MSPTATKQSKKAASVSPTKPSPSKARLLNLKAPTNKVIKEVNKEDAKRLKKTMELTATLTQHPCVIVTQSDKVTQPGNDGYTWPMCQGISNGEPVVADLGFKLVTKLRLTPEVDGAARNIGSPFLRRGKLLMDLALSEYKKEHAIRSALQGLADFGNDHPDNTFENIYVVPAGARMINGIPLSNPDNFPPVNHVLTNMDTFTVLLSMYGNADPSGVNILPTNWARDNPDTAAMFFDTTTLTAQDTHKIGY
jgi:hypothetical protein